MNKFNSFEDFENSLKQLPIPEFDESVIIDRIQVIKHKRCKDYKIRTVVLAAVIFILLISAVVYGKKIYEPFAMFYNVISSASLKDDEGKTAFEYQEVKLSDDQIKINNVAKEKWDIINKNFSGVIYKYQKDLKDNEIGLLVFVETYKINGSCKFLTKDTRYNKLDKLIKNSSLEFKTPTVLPEKYHFKYGYIKNHQTIDKNTGPAAEELYNKALKEGKEYMYKTFKTTDEPSEIILNYADQSGHNDIEIRIGSKYKQFGNSSINTEKIDISRHEAIYESYENINLKTIIFVDNNGAKSPTYTVNFQSPTGMGRVLYPEVVKMIESMFDK